MNLAKIEIIPHEKYEGWFRVIFTSQKNTYGCTSLEMVCSAEIVRHIRDKCNETLEEKAKNKSENSPILTEGKLKNFK